MRKKMMARVKNVEKSGSAMRGKPVVVHGADYGRKGRKSRGRGMR